MNGRVIRKLSALLITLGLVAACSNKKHVPSGVLPREKMEDVLWDMIQADQYSSFLTKDSGHVDLKLERLRLYEQVFQLHDVSRDQFRKSYDYYLAHPDLMQGVLDSLQTKGNRLRSEAYSRPSATVAPIPAPASSPDTAHKLPIRPPLIPVFDHPVRKPVQGHPTENGGQPARDAMHSKGNGGRPVRDTTRSTTKPGTKWQGQ